MGFVLLVVDLVLGSSSGADPIASAFVSVDRAARPHLLVLGGRGHLRSLRLRTTSNAEELLPMVLYPHRETVNEAVRTSHQHGMY